MALLLLIAFLELLTLASPIRDVPSSACSTDFKEFHHLNSSGFHLPLHHPRGPCGPSPVLSDLPFSAVLTHDHARIKTLAGRLSKTPSGRATSLDLASTAESDSSVPLSPGKSVDVGNYVCRMGLGTPSSSYVMVVDTGSSLSWLQCSPCVVSCHAQAGRVFDPSASRTYQSVTCDASQCGDLETATLNPSSCSTSNVCIYQASYGDSSFSVGYLSKDTLSYGGAALPNFVYGCGQDNEGLFGRSDGLIGLARNKMSMFYQLAPVLGRSFSYCLPTPSSSGYLSMGSYSPGQFSYTPMASSSLDDSLYFVNLASISVAGKGLPVSSSAYSSLPLIIDSGTVISRLPTAVYAALSAALSAAMKGAPKASAYSILDTCFKGSLSALHVPDVELVFAGGAVLKLPAANVMLDVDSTTTCLAFAASDSTAIIGNTQQQTFSVVYDVGLSRIGFAAGGCR